MINNFTPPLKRGLSIFSFGFGQFLLAILYNFICLYQTETEKIHAHNVEMRYDARCKVHNQEFTALYMIPGQANPALHEEMSKLFTRSHLANPGRPGFREGCPGLARCERLTRLSCKR